MTTILVVEDSVFQRKQIVKALTPIASKVLQAVNGEDALEVLAVESIDLITTDLLMDKMDGITLIRTFRNTNDEIPIVVISADVQKAIRDECFELGATDFINKPFDKESLATRVQEIIDAIKT